GGRRSARPADGAVDAALFGRPASVCAGQRARSGRDATANDGHRPPVLNMITVAASTQRLWVLERPLALEPSGVGDAFCFLSAVAVLATDGVGVGFVRSLDLRASTEVCLRSPRARSTMERNLARFATLDTALAWAESKKRCWLERGWCERRADPDEP